MDQQKVNEAVEKHKKWLRNEVGGERWSCKIGEDMSGADLTRAELYGADLSGAELSGAKLSGADLSGAELSGANLYGANLTRADLSGANLYGANLTRANLTRANLSGAYLYGANLYGANLTRAELYGANLDYTCWPLWCGSKNVKVDAKIAAQLAAHFCVLDCDDPGYLKARDAVMGFAKTSHRAGDLGL